MDNVEHGTSKSNDVLWAGDGSFNPWSLRNDLTISGVIFGLLRQPAQL